MNILTFPSMGPPRTICTPDPSFVFLSASIHLLLSSARYMSGQNVSRQDVSLAKSLTYSNMYRALYFKLHIWPKRLTYFDISVGSTVKCTPSEIVLT